MTSSNYDPDQAKHGQSKKGKLRWFNPDDLISMPWEYCTIISLAYELLELASWFVLQIQKFKERNLEAVLLKDS